jgi:predicted transcriptional regulator
MQNDLTTIQISKEASEKLKALAESYKRSKSSQAEWLIEQEYKKLAAVKLVGRPTNDPKQKIKA